ncbi:hypothetical protein GCM10022246_22810 [Pedobacter ginsengiterrae]|uniref:DKNYY family protein n=1 Tax=Pedobacter ginsengiterrae TaxID=871696 RepID=A0ABP7PRA0_9SPHI
MKNISIISLIALITFTGCKHGYKVEKGKVFYEYWNEGIGIGQGKQLIEGADAKTFKELKFDCDCDFEFGGDKNKLYIDGKPIRDIDPNTFKFAGNYIFKDKDSVYFFGFYNDINNCAIKGINYSKLKLLTFPWSKADNILVHGYDTLKLEDIEHFVPIDKDWGKTKRYVINKNKILVNADPETFKVINSYSGKDKNHFYEFGKVKR